ncbi:MAG: sensor histidine kinase [Emergencia sp.]
MWISRKKDRKGRLSKEILGLTAAAFLIALFFFGFICTVSDSLAVEYFREKNLNPGELQLLTVRSWIRSISLLTSVLLFVILFLLLLSRKMAYVRELIRGVENLRTSRMEHAVPVEGDNELTELAESINYLAETERQLNLRERELGLERENMIRTLSHDIRTPLTAILSYSEILQGRETPAPEEVSEYIDLMLKKAGQIKNLTDQLLDGEQRRPEHVENGRLLMEQLAAEWEEMLEEDFTCMVSMERCPAFSGTFDIQELRRIFDNLASNGAKYADPQAPLKLEISAGGSTLTIRQSNRKKPQTTDVESRGIGLSSIRRIADCYGGDIKTEQNGELFVTTVTLGGIHLQNSSETP